MQGIIREYYEQLYANKMDNLEEMDRFLEKINLQRLNPEEIENLNNPIANTEIETVIKNLPKNKSPWPHGFTGEFYKTFRVEPMLIFLKLFQKTAEKGTHPNSFYETTITLIPKQGKDIHLRDRTQVLHCRKILLPTELLLLIWASLIAQLVKNLPVMQETTLRSLWIDS